MIASISKIILKLFGWNVVSEQSNHSKCILIGAPHTSNWDFPLTLLSMWALGIRFSWVAKHSLFAGPFGYLFRKLGGIPVDRKARTGFLKDMVRAFREDDSLILAISPEGTRGFTDHWKAGFYNIALKADLDVWLGYVDYPTKTVGLGPRIKPTGNVESDFIAIRQFYQDKQGKFPQNQSIIKLRDREAAVLQREIARSTRASNPGRTITT